MPIPNVHTYVPWSCQGIKLKKKKKYHACIIELHNNIT